MIETERLVLRRFDSSDLVALGKLLGSSVVMESSVDGPLNDHQIEIWLVKRLQEYKSDREIGVLAVVERKNSDLIGYSGLFHYPNMNGASENEIGYRFVRDSWGKGYATEAASAIRDYAFSELNLPRLVALIEPSNVRSIRVAEKIGMKFEKEIMLEEYDYPDNLYSMENPEGYRRVES